MDRTPRSIVDYDAVMPDAIPHRAVIGSRRSCGSLRVERAMAGPGETACIECVSERNLKMSFEQPPHKAKCKL
jgi:hypothetical protein